MEKFFFSVLACALALFPTISAGAPRTFTPEIYQSADGKEAITLVSEHVVERLMNNRTSVGRYVRKKDVLEITFATKGVNFTMIYRVTRAGLVSEYGKVLVKKSPTAGPIELDRQSLQKLMASTPPSETDSKWAKGKVLLEISIDDDGHVTRTKVLEPSGSSEVDAYTQNWIKRRWRFPSGEARTLHQPVHFKLR